jgi:hypothetical protein
MAKLTAAARRAIPTSKFALPDERKYPIEDRSHAANAKARAKQQWEKGALSYAKMKLIERKANAEIRG